MQQRNVSVEICTMRGSKGYVTAEKWEIDNWEVEIIPFEIDFSVKSSICLNIKENIKVRSRILESVQSLVSS